MDLEDALEGFKLAVMFSLPEEAHKHRAGMASFTPKQLYALVVAVNSFQAWREDQEQRISKHLCRECDLDEEDAISPLEARAIVQCLSCGDYFCDYHWTDHLHFSLDEEVPLGRQE